MPSGLAPHQVYSEELAATFRRGHPIAVPHPGLRDGRLERAIDIGDVGYIHPSGGDFVRLFNVHLEPGVGGQPPADNLPDGFSCLPLRDVRRVPSNTQIWLSTSVTRKRLGVDATGPFFGGSVEFESSNDRGAILVTPDPIEWVDALHILSYKEYTQANIENWLRFARDCGHDLSLEDIVLITGVDLTTSWATAVFTNTRLEAGFGLEIQFAGTGAGSKLACQYAWQSTSSALVNSGPIRIQPSPGSHAIPISLVSATGTVSSGVSVGNNAERQPINTRRDQALFIRHIRAKRRRPWRGLKMEARGGSYDPEHTDGDSDDEDSKATTGDAVIVSDSERSELTDCLDPVLDLILKKSDANIAIAHDEDLDILPILRSSLPPYNGIVIQGGIGFYHSDAGGTPSTFQLQWRSNPDSLPVPLEWPHVTYDSKSLISLRQDSAESERKIEATAGPAESSRLLPTPRVRSPLQTERSRRRAIASCVPCRIRRVRCIYSASSDGSPLRCQRCRERGLDCSFESMPVISSPQSPTQLFQTSVSSEKHSVNSPSMPVRERLDPTTHETQTYHDSPSNTSPNPPIGPNDALSVGPMRDDLV